MSYRFELDPKLRAYATDEQWQLLQAIEEHGSRRKAAAATGTPDTTLRRTLAAVLRRAAQQGYAPSFDIKHEVPAGLTLKGTSLRYDGDGKVDQYWNKTKVQGRPDEETTHVPDPKIITKVSTLFDNQGQVTQQWVSEKPEAKQQLLMWEEAAKAMAEKLPAIAPIPAPKFASDKLMACYPVGDHHLGMLSWHEETGADYDLGIGENLLRTAIDHLVTVVPSCKRSLVAFLGDFMHYDSFESVTPTSRNLLDADGRFPKMVRAAIRTMRYMIETAARHHETVEVIVEIGNHDLSSSIFLMECLANIYAENPRIKINTSPAHFHYVEFGQCLIGTHHGHGASMERLPLVMATDCAAIWGRTKHRYWWTGHIHTRKAKVVADQAQDFNGCSVESFQILAPADAWAAQKGYRSTRSMKAIVLHKERGEVARHTVNPEMCE